MKQEAGSVRDGIGSELGLTPKTDTLVMELSASMKQDCANVGIGGRMLGGLETISGLLTRRLH